MAEGRKENIRELESRSKPKVETYHKTEEEILKIMYRCGVSKRFLAAQKADIEPKIWNQVQGFLTGESIFLFGHAGVGKSHIAVALIREKISSDNEMTFSYPDGHSTKYMPSYPRMISVPDLLLEIRECFHEGTGGNESGLIQRYAEKKCLILDDLGAEKTSEWSIQTLYSIVDRRYRDVMQTLITSNLTLDEIAVKVGDRIASRIAGMCKVVEVKGRDRRLKS